MEFDEARQVAEIGFPGGPDGLERLLGALFHLEAIHGDKHCRILLFDQRRFAACWVSALRRLRSLPV
jgi:hypothetical protein